MSKITVNSKKCMGCGACAELHPNIFQIGDDGTSFVKRSPEEDADLIEIIEICPNKAIEKI